MGKKFNKKPKIKQLEIVSQEINKPLETTRSSDEPIPKKEKWTNKQRVLVFAARGINHRDRHFLQDIKKLMPHHRPEAKMERSKTLSVVNDMCTMKHCNKAILFEGRRKRDLYMWNSNIQHGPSIKFLLENVHTMGELKLTGNCLRGSRPLLSFDSKFDEEPHLSLIKESLAQTFSVPNHHPKSQPFFDHVYTFTYLDKRIWFRNFQILSEDGGLSEIGPRFTMNPIKIFEGSFGGNVLWENEDYVSPAKHRQMLKKISKNKYINRIEQKVSNESRAPKHAYEFNEYDTLFEGDNPMKAAKQISEKVKNKKPTIEKKKSNLVKKIKIKKDKLKKNIQGKKKIKGKNV